MKNIKSVVLKFLLKYWASNMYLPVGGVNSSVFQSYILMFLKIMLVFIELISWELVGTSSLLLVLLNEFVNVVNLIAMWPFKSKQVIQLKDNFG